MAKQQHPIGLTVTAVRPLTKSEMKREGWDGVAPIALVFSDGSIYYSSCDSEGNGPGEMFGCVDGKTIILV